MGPLTKMEPCNCTIGLVELVNYIGGLSDKTICEIGCFLGISTETFLCFNPKKLYAIDIWGLNEQYSECDWIFNGRPNFNDIEQQFRNMAKNYNNVEIIKNYSKYACHGFQNESLDVVYIDGEHTYTCVSDDIKCWLPKIKKGGYMCGHDIVQHQIESAVIDTLKTNNVVKFSDSSWLVKIQ